MMRTQLILKNTELRLRYFKHRPNFQQVSSLTSVALLLLQVRLMLKYLAELLP